MATLEELQKFYDEMSGNVPTAESIVDTAGDVGQAAVEAGNAVRDAAGDVVSTLTPNLGEEEPEPRGFMQGFKDYMARTNEPRQKVDEDTGMMETLMGNVVDLPGRLANDLMDAAAWGVNAGDTALMNLPSGIASGDTSIYDVTPMGMLDNSARMLMGKDRRDNPTGPINDVLSAPFDAAEDRLGFAGNLSADAAGSMVGGSAKIAKWMDEVFRSGSKVSRLGSNVAAGATEEAAKAYFGGEGWDEIKAAAVGGGIGGGIGQAVFGEAMPWLYKGVTGKLRGSRIISDLVDHGSPTSPFYYKNFDQQVKNLGGTKDSILTADQGLGYAPHQRYMSQRVGQALALARGPSYGKPGSIGHTVQDAKIRERLEGNIEETINGTIREVDDRLSNVVGTSGDNYNMFKARRDRLNNAEMVYDQINGPAGKNITFSRHAKNGELAGAYRDRVSPAQGKFENFTDEQAKMIRLVQGKLEQQHITPGYSPIKDSPQARIDRGEDPQAGMATLADLLEARQAVQAFSIPGGMLKEGDATSFATVKEAMAARDMLATLDDQIFDLYPAYKGAREEFAKEMRAKDLYYAGQLMYNTKGADGIDPNSLIKGGDFSQDTIDFYRQLPDDEKEAFALGVRRAFGENIEAKSGYKTVMNLFTDGDPLALARNDTNEMKMGNVKFMKEILGEDDFNSVVGIVTDLTPRKEALRTLEEIMVAENLSPEARNQIQRDADNIIMGLGITGRVDPLTSGPIGAFKRWGQAQLRGEGYYTDLSEYAGATGEELQELHSKLMSDFMTPSTFPQAGTLSGSAATGAELGIDASTFMDGVLPEFGGGERSPEDEAEMNAIMEFLGSN